MIDSAQADDRRSQVDLVHEALRINLRFLEEIIEPHEVCPYAKTCRAQGGLVRKVFTATEPDVDPACDFLAEMESGPKHVEIGLMIFPRLELSPRAFETFSTTIRETWTVRAGHPPLFAHAPFHPDYPYDPRSPDSLVYYFRRSPDPTIQLVRLSVLDRVRGSHHGTRVFDLSRMDLDTFLAAPSKSITDKITNDNFDRAQAGAREPIDRAFASIRADRDRSYRGL